MFLKKTSLILPQTSVLSRRSLLKGATATAFAAPFVNRFAGSARAQGARTVNFAGYGGSYGDVLREVWFEPFEAETGIHVNMGVGASLALARLQQMNPAGAEWDLIDLTNAEYTTAQAADLLMPIDANIVDSSKILPGYMKSHGFGYVTFVWVMGRNSDLISAEEAPQTWTEFWDVERYPSKRSLMAVVTDGSAIEAALMADGVSHDEMYPVDLDRAFASFDMLGHDNIVWTTSLQEPVQRIGSGETPLGGIYTGRAIMANRQGAKIGYTMNQGIVGGVTMAPMKNSSHGAEAMELINFMATRPDLAAEFAMRTSYGFPHTDVESLLPADAHEIRAALPSSPQLLANGVVTDDKWWAANLAEIVTRFQEWQLT